MTEWGDGFVIGIESGRRHALDDAEAAVADMNHHERDDGDDWVVFIRRDAAIAAIRALKEKP